MLDNPHTTISSQANDEQYYLRITLILYLCELNTKSIVKLYQFSYPLNQPFNLGEIGPVPGIPFHFSHISSARCATIIGFYVLDDAKIIPFGSVNFTPHSTHHGVKLEMTYGSQDLRNVLYLSCDLNFYFKTIKSLTQFNVAVVWCFNVILVYSGHRQLIRFDSTQHALHRRVAWHFYSVFP